MVKQMDKPAPPEYAATAAPSFQTTFASISLHMTDRIRLLQFPQQDISSVRSVILENWRLGIQAERPYNIAHEYKLRGNPWSGQGSEAVPARILMRGIFAYLFSVGWILTASTDISKKMFDKDTLIFRKQPTPPPPSIWVGISFNHGDRLRLIGAPPDLIAAFQKLLKDMKLLQSEQWKEKQGNAYEFKINGYPWRPSGEETMSTRLLILKMVELLERFGWSLYASIDQNNGHHNNNASTSETDSWYCVKAVDWMPGSTVFHR